MRVFGTSLLGAGMGVGLALLTAPAHAADCAAGDARHFTVAANKDTVHWGYFSKDATPLI
ncbi:hypothetical protein ASALC70_03573 [Alcanivorax sp. ALC70]|nr:hypothetical protein [Alcanivorax sp. ZXX171]UWN51346.1 hypothetical protein ASALC70_03573 [Alcanivorax sp. ALC70]|tara:strand:- start:101 stop:280 length:180 start_codon:yes stop_codon:yes gene_type:complete